MSLPIVFPKPDSESAREAFAHAYQAIPEGVPVVGLVFKVVQTADDDETLVNFRFADADLLRSLALILSLKGLEAHKPSKES